MKLVQKIVLEYYRKKFKALSLLSNEKAARSAFRLFCTPYTKKNKDIAAPVFQQGEKISMNIHGDPVYGFRFKPKSPSNHNEKTVLVCHGFDSCSYRFSDYIISLIDAGYTVITFDAPAHGISRGKTITILKYVEMIEKINQTFGPINGILAHSFGGLAAVLALEKMEDIHCKSLVLVSPSTETTFAIEKFLGFVQVKGEVRKQFYQLIETLGGHPAKWYSVARAIENIDVPTLWVHDYYDKITPYKHVKPVRDKELPNVTFQITEKLGHSPYRDAGVHKSIMDFLTHTLETN